MDDFDVDMLIGDDQVGPATCHRARRSNLQMLSLLRVASRPPAARDTL